MADKDRWVSDGVQPVQRRNAALIALLAITGLRRSEAAAPGWFDIDLENRVVSVWHGKGDKAREVAIVGDNAVEALLAWLERQGADRELVFCSVGQGGQLGAVRPITGTDVYRVVKATESRSGVAFRPHDQGLMPDTDLRSAVDMRARERFCGGKRGRIQLLMI